VVNAVSSSVAEATRDLRAHVNRTILEVLEETVMALRAQHAQLLNLREGPRPRYVRPWARD